MNCLLRMGAMRDALAVFDAGRARGHVPSPDTALLLLRRYADIAWQPGASQLWQELEASGVALGSEHYNALMASLFFTFGEQDTLQMQIIGTSLPGMDTDGVNMGLAAMRDHPMQLGDTGQPWNPSALLRGLEANLGAQGCAPTALTHVLALEVACLIGLADVAMHHLDALAGTAEAEAEGSGGTELLSEPCVGSLVDLLSRQGRGEELLYALAALHRDGLALPPDLGHCDSRFRTLATRWLAAERSLSLGQALLSTRVEREERTSAAAAKRDAASARAQAAAGLPVFEFPPLSKLKVADLRAEALALQLDAQGTRKDVNDRVRAARLLLKDGTAPPDLVQAARTAYTVLHEPEAEAAAMRAAAPPQPAAPDWDDDHAPAGDPDAAAPDFRAAASARRPVQAQSSWRGEALGASEAAQLGEALCLALQRVGLVPTQADLVAIAREAAAAAQPDAALRLLRAAQAAGGGCAALFVCAAEACVAAGDRAAALRVLDEADLVGGHALGDDVVSRVLRGDAGCDDHVRTLEAEALLATPLPDDEEWEEGAEWEEGGGAEEGAEWVGRGEVAVTAAVPHLPAEAGADEEEWKEEEEEGDEEGGR